MIDPSPQAPTAGRTVLAAQPHECAVNLAHANSTPSYPGAASQLAASLKDLCAAGTREDIAIAAARGARRVAGADGVCMLLQGSDRYLFATADSLAPLYLVPDASPLYQLAASACLRAHTTVNTDLAADAGIRLPGNVLVRTASVVGVPLAPESACTGMGFFWTSPRVPGSEPLCALEALALATSLALNAKTRDAELRGAREGQRRLLSELQHRVRNILAFVRSIIRRTGESASSAENFALHLEARISALSRTQGTLAVIGAAGIELEDLVRTELTANAVRETQFVVRGPPVRLRTRAAETMALTLHELTTNALKYGALARSSGSLSITWQIDVARAPARLQISWIESGVTIAALAPRQRGFGQELIERTLPYELDAITGFTLTPGGMHCEIDLPLTSRTRGTGKSRRGMYIEDDRHEAEPAE